MNVDCGWRARPWGRAHQESVVGTMVNIMKGKKMIGVIVALVFLVGSLGIMAGAIIINQIHGTYGSALAVPIYNALGIILALVGLGVAAIAHHKHKEMILAKRTLVLGLFCVIILAVLFPFSETGALSVIRR